MGCVQELQKMKFWNVHPVFWIFWEFLNGCFFYLKKKLFLNSSFQTERFFQIGENRWGRGVHRNVHWNIIFPDVSYESDTQ